RPLRGIVERILEGRRLLQRLQERHDVLDLVLAVEAVLAPWRHHGLRIVDAGIEDVVEEVLVAAAGAADQRQVGPDIARYFLCTGSHHVTGKAAAAATPVEGELLAFGGIACDRARGDFLAPRRRDIGRGKRVVGVPVRRVPAGIPVPRRRRGGAFELQRHGLRVRHRGNETKRQKRNRNSSVHWAATLLAVALRAIENPAASITFTEFSCSPLWKFAKALPSSQGLMC